MAHFAELDNNNTVLRVIVVHNNELLDSTGQEQESKGKEFCFNLFGGFNWVQTSYSASFRKNFAGIGYTYNSALDAFIPPKPFPSWTLNDQTAQWEPPVALPQDGETYVWNESLLLWNKVSMPILQG
jgi:hypothetical protein